MADLLTERALKWLRCTVERLMKDMGFKKCRSWQEDKDYDP